MLPNWLYGKSKSKLATILGGGGGTPADYDQVKAQVSQNTEDIELLSDTLDGKAALTQISNRNLLDNPWFTVNQRGLSTYSNVNYSYTVDRWLGSSGFDLYVDSDGVSVSSGNKSIFERFEDSLYNFLVGKTVTLSVLKSTGSIVSVSGVVKSNGNSFAYEGDSDVSLYLTKDSYAKFIQVVFKNTTVTLRAVKLELGSVSTLAMDIAPNYATELLKCQRYFYRFQNSMRGTCIPGWILNTNARAAVHLPTGMRSTPTINASGPCPWITSTGTSIESSGLSINTSNNKDITIMQQSAFPNIAGEALCILRIDVSAYIDFTAEL